MLSIGIFFLLLQLRNESLLKDNSNFEKKIQALYQLKKFEMKNTSKIQILNNIEKLEQTNIQLNPIYKSYKNITYFGYSCCV